MLGFSWKFHGRFSPHPTPLLRFLFDSPSYKIRLIRSTKHRAVHKHGALWDLDLGIVGCRDGGEGGAKCLHSHPIRSSGPNRAAWTRIDPKETSASAGSWLSDGLGSTLGFEADRLSHSLTLSNPTSRDNVAISKTRHSQFRFRHVHFDLSSVLLWRSKLRF
jgi:hypothetical protein